MITVVAVAKIREHLKFFDLVTKVPEPLEGGSVLGLGLERNREGKLEFKRGNGIPELKVDLTSRELFSEFGKLVGHYPIAGWL